MQSLRVPMPSITALPQPPSDNEILSQRITALEAQVQYLMRDNAELRAAIALLQKQG